MYSPTNFSTLAPNWPLILSGISAKPRTAIFKSLSENTRTQAFAGFGWTDGRNVRKLKLRKRIVFVAQPDHAAVRALLAVRGFESHATPSPSPAMNSRRLSITSSATDEHRWWNFKTKRFGGLEVDDQLEVCRQLNGQIRWLRPA
jgi:hypothetical protein